MKKRLLTMLLTFSLLLSATSSVFATEKSIKIAKTNFITNQNENEEKTVIVVLKENSKVDFESLKTKEGKEKRIAETKVLRDAFVSTLKEKDVEFEKIYEYDLLFAGFALKLKNKELEKISKIDSVESIEISKQFSKPTVFKKEEEFESRRFRSVDSNKLINVTDEVYRKYNGQGRVVAVLDTGIDVSHPILRVTDVNKGKYPTKDSMDKKLKEVGIDYGSWRNDKVVYAHNYFTNGENVKEDLKEDSHGMHVSGSAVGNPEKEEVFDSDEGTKSERIIGVAPEAQLIFMGVFDGEITYTHMYQKALEDSVKLGADSINLSLGSPNGSELSVGKSMDKAIEYARNMGVIVAIAGGNDGHFGFGGTKPPVTNPDYGVMGSPATSKDALTVAAMYTTADRIRTIRLKDETGFIKTGDYFKGRDEDDDLTVDFISPGKENEEYEIVDGGLGRKQDLETKNVKDKIVVIKRGEISFGEKIVNAQEKEAKGVIIYNHENGGEDIVNMLFQEWADQIKIPSVFIGNEGGKKLLSNLGKKVIFSRKLTVIPYADGGQLTDFSSYGLSADGTFKPDITAPGGLIYSSINNNKYISMNGTSMATPHVAGAVAIIREAFNERHSEIKGKEEYDIIKAIMMSTADPVKERISGNYFSPRKQGAGALNVEKAIASDLYVLDSENNPKAFLGNIENDTVEMKLKVKNIGSTEKTLTYKTVLGTDEVKDGKFNLTTKLLDTINGETIKVPAKGETEVSITIDAKKYDEQLKPLMPNGHFLEGFVFFNEVDGQKAVSIAFSGFRGNWSNIPLWEKPIYDFNLQKEEPIYFRGDGIVKGNFTSLVALEKNPYTYDKKGQDFNFYGNFNEIPLGAIVNSKGFEFKKENIAISPNDDGNKDFLAFKGVFFRNSQYIYAKVLNEKGEEVFRSRVAYSTKNSINHKPEAPRSVAIDETSWNAYNLPDGKYKYVVCANSETPGASEQELPFDVIVDRVSPIIKTPVVDSINRKYKPEILEELSGIENTVITYFDQNGQTKWLELNKDGEFIFPMDCNLDDLSKISVHTFDNAGNISSLNLDGSEYMPSVPEDLGANIRPILNITNFKDFEGNHIEGSENLNMFPIEINWREQVGLKDHSVNDYIPFSYNNELMNVKEGKYDVFIAQIPDVYEPLNPNTMTVEVKEGETKDVVFKTSLKETVIPHGNGAVNFNLVIPNYNENFIDSSLSYVIKNKIGNVVNRDDLQTYEKMYNTPVKEGNKLVGVRYHRAKMTILPEGEYTVEITSYNDKLKIDEKVKSFKVEAGKSTLVTFEAEEIVSDIVNIVLNYDKELPEGTKIILINEDTDEEIEIKEAKLNKKVFSANVENGEYRVKVVLPEGYKADRNDFGIEVDNQKVVESVNIEKLEEIKPITPSIPNKVKKLEKNISLLQKITVENENGFEDDIELVVEKIANDFSEEKDLDVYDIYFKNKKTGQRIELGNGEYKVTITKRQEQEVKNIYHIADGNKFEDVNFTQDDKYVVFKTTHFSKYALEYAKSNEQNNEEKPEDTTTDGSVQTNSDNTNTQNTNSKNGLVKTNISENIAVLSILAIIALAGVVISKKSRR